jgi:hypothetical protein
MSNKYSSDRQYFPQEDSDGVSYKDEPLSPDDFLGVKSAKTPQGYSYRKERPRTNKAPSENERFVLEDLSPRLYREVKNQMEVFL